MNRNQFMDAVGYLDPKMIEEHMVMKCHLQTDKSRRKNLRYLRAASVAACFALLPVFAFLFSKLLFAGEAGAAGTAGHLVVVLGLSLLLAVAAGLLIWKIGCFCIKKKHRKPGIKPD